MKVVISILRLGSCTKSQSTFTTISAWSYSLGALLNTDIFIRRLKWNASFYVLHVRCITFEVDLDKMRGRLDLRPKVDNFIAGKQSYEKRKRQKRYTSKLKKNTIYEDVCGAQTYPQPSIRQFALKTNSQKNLKNLMKKTKK